MYITEKKANAVIEPSLILNLREIAEAVELRFGTSMIPYREGYYLAGKETPVIEHAKSYYQIEKTPAWVESGFTKINSISDIKGTVYDDEGNIVLNYNGGTPIEKLLKNTPTLPYRGFNLIKEVLEHRLYQILAWGEFPNLTDKEIIVRYIQTNTIDSKKSIESVYGEVISNISNFIEGPVLSYFDLIRDFTFGGLTNCYDFKAQGMNLKITKLLDYRIYEYERLKIHLEELGIKNIWSMKTMQDL